MALRSHPARNNARGQAHSPAIESRLKIAPLAGLFRPTGRTWFTDNQPAPNFRNGRPARRSRFDPLERYSLGFGNEAKAEPEAGQRKDSV
jgi:hypothetical protein